MRLRNGEDIFRSQPFPIMQGTPRTASGVTRFTSYVRLMENVGFVAVMLHRAYLSIS
jgi:hypothetical protein